MSTTSYRNVLLVVRYCCCPGLAALYRCECENGGWVFRWCGRALETRVAGIDNILCVSPEMVLDLSPLSLHTVSAVCTAIGDTVPTHYVYYIQSTLLVLIFFLCGSFLIY